MTTRYHIRGKTRLVRRVSLCEYATLVTRGVLDQNTAPFAVMDADRDQSDCIPPTVPVGGIMLWPDEPLFGWTFGDVRTVFDVPDDAIVWRGQGRYTIYSERYSYIEDRSWTEQYPVFVNEVAVMRLDAEWLVDVTFDIDVDPVAWREPDGTLDGYVSRCWGQLRHEGTCPACLEWAMIVQDAG